MYTYVCVQSCISIETYACICVCVCVCVCEREYMHMHVMLHVHSETCMRHDAPSVWGYEAYVTHTPCLVLTVQHTATPCNTLQHTTTHCNALQHSYMSYNVPNLNVLQNMSLVTLVFFTKMTYNWRKWVMATCFLPHSSPRSRRAPLPHELVPCHQS